MSSPPIESRTESVGRWQRALLGLAVLMGCGGEPHYSLVVVSAELPSVDPSKVGCPTWDCAAPPLSNPDPFVVVTPGSSRVHSFRTYTVRDSLAPRWGQVAIDDQTADVFANPMSIDIVDEDDDVFNADDRVAHFDVQITQAQLLAGGPIVLTTPVGAQTATLTLEVR